MKIVIDAYNLGLLQGTGIATYARVLSRILSAAGHEVFPLYGLRKVDAGSAYTWAQFLQRLSIYGEENNSYSFVRDLDFSLGMVRGVMYLPLEAKQITVNSHIVDAPLRSRLPAYTNLFNTPSLYRLAQASSFLKGKTISIRFPHPIDVLHLTCPLALSCRGVAKIVTVHDIIPLVLPTSTKVNLKHYSRSMVSSLHDANMIFAVSEHTKNDLVRHFQVPENKIHVTYQSVQIPQQYKQIHADALSDFLDRHFNLRQKEYFLFYGAIEPKKNVARILEAFAIAKTDYPILIVGKDGWLHADVDAFFEQQDALTRGKVNNRFIRVPYVSHHALMHLIKGARGLVFPSLYEGFGLPVLEAMEMGCPVITSHVSALSEVGGDAVHYVDPYDVNDIAAAIDQFAADDNYISSLVDKGYAQAKQYSPQRYQERLMQGYEKALS